MPMFGTHMKKTSAPTMPKQAALSQTTSESGGKGKGVAPKPAIENGKAGACLTINKRRDARIQQGKPKYTTFSDEQVDWLVTNHATLGWTPNKVAPKAMIEGMVQQGVNEGVLIAKDNLWDQARHVLRNEIEKKKP